MHKQYITAPYTISKNSSFSLYLSLTVVHAVIYCNLKLQCCNRNVCHDNDNSPEQASGESQWLSIETLWVQIPMKIIWNCCSLKIFPWINKLINSYFSQTHQVFYCKSYNWFTIKTTVKLTVIYWHPCCQDLFFLQFRQMSKHKFCL